jgi:hydroxymethylbilane synthase
MSEEISLPAIGQGALGIETRTDDREIEDLTRFFNDPTSSFAVSGERAFLKKLEGGCQVPIAACGSSSTKWKALRKKPSLSESSWPRFF